MRFRSGFRGGTATAAGGAEQGGDDVTGGARGGRDVSDGGQLGHPLAGLAQVRRVIGPPGLRCLPGAGRRGLRGGRAQRTGQDRERRPVGGQQQPGARVTRLRQPRGVERAEIAGCGDREFLALPLAEPDRALRADLLRRLLEGNRGHCPGVAGDDPRRVRVLTPVQLRVLRVQILLAPPAVGDPRCAHRPVDHDPGPLVPILAARARIPVRPDLLSW